MRITWLFRVSFAEDAEGVEDSKEGDAGVSEDGEPHVGKPEKTGYEDDDLDDDGEE